LSAWTPLALFWQDALVALVFAAVDSRCGRTRGDLDLVLAHCRLRGGKRGVDAGSLIAAHLADVARGGRALTDSIRHYLTPGNLALMATVMVAAGVFATIAGRRAAMPYASALTASEHIGLLRARVVAIWAPWPRAG
jgi:hypothetical protein